MNLSVHYMTGRQENYLVAVEALFRNMISKQECRGILILFPSPCGCVALLPPAEEILSMAWSSVEVPPIPIGSTAAPCRLRWAYS